MTGHKEIPLTDVKSTVISGHGYDPATQTMRVRFNGGKMYDYEGVPADKYAAFTGAASLGSFHAKKIKPVHTAKKVE
jgi:hypothetical protein